MIKSVARLYLAATIFTGGVGLAATAYFGNGTIPAMIALSVTFIGAYGANPLFWSLPTSFLTGGAAAAGIALINSFGNLAGSSSPYLIDWIKDSTGDTAFGLFILSVFLVFGALMSLAVPSRLVDR